MSSLAVYIFILKLACLRNFLVSLFPFLFGVFCLAFFYSLGKKEIITLN
jgi:hypothetical protein